MLYNIVVVRRVKGYGGILIRSVVNGRLSKGIRKDGKVKCKVVYCIQGKVQVFGL